MMNTELGLLAPLISKKHIEMSWW